VLTVRSVNEEKMKGSCVPCCYENTDTHEWCICLHSSPVCT